MLDGKALTEQGVALAMAKKTCGLFETKRLWAQNSQLPSHPSAGRSQPGSEESSGSIAMYYSYCV
jgi:hypothetical protein